MQPGANDQRLAAALIERHPDGLDQHLQLVAQQAWLQRELDKQYEAQKRQGPELSIQGRQPLLELEP